MIKKFVSKEATWRRPFWNCIRKPGCVCVTSFLRLGIQWRRGQKSATEFASLTRSEIFFFKRLSTSLSSVLSFSELEHVWFKTIWLSKMAATRSNLGFFGNEFRNENLHFRDKLWWVTNLSARFLLMLTKDIRFLGLTFSFKVFRPGKVQLFFCHSQDRSKRFYAGRTKKNRENFDWIITARLSFHHQTSFFTTSMDFRCLPGAKQISTAENRHGQIKWNTTTWTVIDCATPPLYVLYFRRFRAHRALTFYMYKTVHAQHDVKGRWLWCTWKSTENGVSDDSLNKVTFLVDQTSTL